MKLSEVIKAIEEGSNNVFKSGEHRITKSSLHDNHIYFKFSSLLIIDGWEEIKPKEESPIYIGDLKGE